MVDVETGLTPDLDTKTVIFESFKSGDNFLADLEKSSNKYRLRSYDSTNEQKILRFY